jgi:hypothetical protein
MSDEVGSRLEKARLAIRELPLPGRPSWIPKHLPVGVQHHKGRSFLLLEYGLERTNSKCEPSFDALVMVQVRNNQANEKHRVPDHVCERIAAR